MPGDSMRQPVIVRRCKHDLVDTGMNIQESRTYNRQLMIIRATLQSECTKCGEIINFVVCGGFHETNGDKAL